MVAERIGEQAWLTISEVRDHFDEVMARVEGGESVVITRNGQVLAELTPGSEAKREPDPAPAGSAMEEFLKERATWKRAKVTREEILAWRHEGHRW